MDSTFVIDPAYVDFLSNAIPVFVAVSVLCMPLWGFGFRLGWRVYDFLVRCLVDTVSMILEMLLEGVIFPILLRNKVTGPMLLRYKAKMRRDDGVVEAETASGHKNERKEDK